MNQYTTDIATRFWNKVNKTDTCWLWTGAKNKDGYGMFGVHTRLHILAHRYSYTVSVDFIPDGLVLDHLCRIRHCVNPDHLEPVTQVENMRRILRIPAGIETSIKLAHWCAKCHRKCNFITCSIETRCCRCCEVSKLLKAHSKKKK